MIPSLKSLDLNRSGSSSVGLSSRLRRSQPPDQPGQRDRADRQQRADGFAAFLPHQDAEHDAAHAEDGEDRADAVDAPRAGVGNVADEFDAGQHDRDDDDLEQERDPPRQVGGDEPAEQWPDRGGDRGRGSDQRVDLAPGPLLRSCRG